MEDFFDFEHPSLPLATTINMFGTVPPAPGAPLSPLSELLGLPPNTETTEFDWFSLTPHVNWDTYDMDIAPAQPHDPPYFCIHGNHLYSNSLGDEMASMILLDDLGMGQPQEEDDQLTSSDTCPSDQTIDSVHSDDDTSLPTFFDNDHELYDQDLYDQDLYECLGGQYGEQYVSLEDISKNVEQQAEQRAEQQVGHVNSNQSFVDAWNIDNMTATLPPVETDDMLLDEGPNDRPLELRPRNPQHPAPPNIHLTSRNLEEYLPYVQLDAKLPLATIYAMLGLSQDEGKDVKIRCLDLFNKKGYEALNSGSRDADALRDRKLSLLQASLVLVVNKGMGEELFGPGAQLNQRSHLVWPLDSTQITLHFTKLLYRLTRSRRRPRQEPVPVVDIDMSVSLPAPAVSSAWLQRPQTMFQHNSPSCLREQLVAQKRTQSQMEEMELADSPVSALSSTSINSTPSSPPSSSATPPAKRLRAAASANGDTPLTYLVSITDPAHTRLVPRMVLFHTGSIRVDGYSFVHEQCVALGRRVTSVAIITMAGLVEVGNLLSWDRAVDDVCNNSVMDKEVRVVVVVE